MSDERNDGLTWRLRHEERGHRWMGGYRDGILVTVRCERCTRTPIEVLRMDFTSESCPAMARDP